MATLFSDNFDRANSETVDATNWTETSGAWSISSNQLAVTPGGFGSCITTAAAHAAVADCKASIKRITGSGFDGGPCVRSNSGGTTMYYLDVYSTNTLEIYRRVGGSDTLVDGRTQTHGANDVYTLEVSGVGATVTLKIFRNGVQVGGDISDGDAARITTAGQAGVIAWDVGNFDDFLAEDLAAPADPYPAGYVEATRSTLLRM